MADSHEPDRSTKASPLRVLAIDPFHGGSHRQFLRGAVKHSRHHWTLVTGKPVHWKWRMRSAPVCLTDATRKTIDTKGYPDAIFCSDMLDLPLWRGLLRDPRIQRTPAAVYFHENQWTYPQSPGARIDFHFGYTNLVTALAADACWFNSAFHRDDFLTASESFLQRMPDGKQAHQVKTLHQRCLVIPPGFDPPESPPSLRNESTVPASGAITIGWVSRWENDKRPDRFVDLLRILYDRNLDFRLVLLGARPPAACESLETIRTRYSDQILHDGYAESSEQYWEHLGSIDVVVSTADHEFFGIAICESIWAGAVPVLPNRLSYPELAPPDCLYDSLEHAATMIESLRSPDARTRMSAVCRDQIQSLQMEHTVTRLDEELCGLAAASADRVPSR